MSWQLLVFSGNIAYNSLIYANFSGFNEFSTDTLLRDIYVKTTEKARIVTGKQIGRASCRERV